MASEQQPVPADDGGVTAPAGTVVADGAAAEPAPEAAPSPQFEVHRTVDLTLGAWRPREAATQLAAAAGIALAPGLDADPATSPVAVGLRGIDAAVVSDPIAVLAHDDATRIAAALPVAATIVVLAPRFGRGLGTFNDWLFFYLRRAALSLVVVGDEPATAMARTAFERRRGIEAPPVGKPAAEFAPAQQRLLRFFPGPLPRTVAERYVLDPAEAALLPVGASHFLIPPGYRDADPAVSAPALDAMEETEALDDGLKALAQTFCTAHFADSGALTALAADAFRSGELDLARELAARARNVARDPTAVATADLLRQEIRLYQRRFTEILATPEPSRRAPEEIRERLAKARLRAAIEHGERGGAPLGLDATVARLDDGKADADDLHLLSLHVAARVADGEVERGRALAGKVDAAAAEVRDQRVAFLAALNLAALARRGGDKSGEREALVRAFATGEGTRGLGEIVAMNVAFARAEEDAASAAARAAWLRAALAWLAFEPVEAFPVPAVDAVLGTVSVPRTQIDQAVSDALRIGLARALPRREAADTSEASLPAVRRSGDRALVAERIVGGPGAAVLWSSRRAEGQALSPPRQTLLGTVWRALQGLCPAAAALESGTIVVDDNLGLDLPATREAALGVALRMDVAEVLFGNDRIAVDAMTRPRYAGDLRVSLSPAVAAITPAGVADGSAGGAGATAIGAAPAALTIRFRRHLPETTVSGREAELLAPIRERGKIALGSLAVLLGIPLVETERLLRDLELRRIVRFEVEGRPPGPGTDGELSSSAS